MAIKRQKRPPSCLLFSLITVLLLLVLIWFIHLPRLVAPDAVPVLISPVDGCHYIGSDENYHYFEHGTLWLIPNTYLVDKDKLQLKREYRKGTGGYLWRGVDDPRMCVQSGDEEDE